ncbi:MAG: thioester reductase domain-containing protein [Cyanobacteria bacterium P01_F01_bin.150]
MSDPIVYLKPNAIAEPLINQWYAWSYLIPPATAACYITESHLKVMESFIRAPQVHVTALQDPEMRGGPFIDYDVSKVDDIKALYDLTVARESKLLELYQAIQQLDAMLEDFRGESLEPFYKDIPGPLKGYVELVYDRYHRPSFRLLEGLLYRSEYYHTDSQSVVLYVGDEDDRAFVLSTPRLDTDDSMQVALPFADPRWNDLFRMRQQGRSLSEIQELFKDVIPPDKIDFWSTLFTTEPQPKCENYSGDGIRIRYLGHACVLIETRHVSILCDPIISYHHQSSSCPRFSFSDLPETIDYAMITHNHQDHIMFESMLQLRHKVKNIIVPKSHKGSLIDPSLKTILNILGFDNVREIDELENVPFPQGEIVSLPVFGEHGDLNIGAKNAYMIRIGDRSIICAADSNNIDPALYDNLHDIFGDLDVLFIGMECEGAPFTWAYDSLLGQTISRRVAATRRLDGSNAERATELVDQLHPQHVYVYAMGQEPWLNFITSIVYTDDSPPIIESNKFVKYCKQLGIDTERLYGCKEIHLDMGADSPKVMGRGRTRKLEEAKVGANGLPLAVPQKKKGNMRSQTAALATHAQQNSPQNGHHISKAEQEKKRVIAAFLSTLAKQDIRLWIEEDGVEEDKQEAKLRCNAPKGVLTKDLQLQIKNQKPDIIAFLQQQKEQQHGEAETNSQANSQANSQRSIHNDELTPEQEQRRAIATFLTTIAKKDIRLWIEEDGQDYKLRCNAPKGVLTKDLQLQIKEQKPEIIAFLKRQKGQLTQTKTLDLSSEVKLDPSINPQNCRGDLSRSIDLNNPSTTVLLTGANGFMGSFILFELLKQTNARIYCLVRAKTNEAAFERIRSSLASYYLWEAVQANSFKSRIVPIAGDLSEPQFRLSDDKLSKLAQEVDVIYHNGAWVHHGSPYSLLKPTNVLGTEEILRLACTEKLKPVHFVSTISVFPLQAEEPTIYEQDSLTKYAIPTKGYAQTKWVAESMMAIARERGLPVSIYRLGPISGHSQTGVFNANDFLYRLMMGYIQLGSAPDGQVMLDVLPVDYASQALVYLSINSPPLISPSKEGRPELLPLNPLERQAENKGRAGEGCNVFHLLHAAPVTSEILFSCIQNKGYDIQRMPYDKWRKKLLKIAQSSPEHHLYPLVALFPTEQTPTEQTNASSNFNSKDKPTIVEFDCQNAILGLKNSSLSCPPIDEELIDIYLSYLIKSNQIQPPNQSPCSLD